MFLGELEIVFAETFGIEPCIDVTLKRQYRLAGVVRGERRVPVLETLGVQLAELVADVHQVADLVRLQFLELVDQFTGVVQEIRLGMGFRCQRAFVVQRLGR